MLDNLNLSNSVIFMNFLEVLKFMDFMNFGQFFGFLLVFSLIFKRYFVKSLEV